MTNLQRIRRQQVRAQRGLCFYCRQPMWEGCPEPFATQYGLKGSRLHWLQATAEHLHARSEGGADRVDNIVAACRFCNSRRHQSPRPLSPQDHALKAQQRLAAGKWHGIRLRADALATAELAEVITENTSGAQASPLARTVRPEAYSGERICLRT